MKIRKQFDISLSHKFPNGDIVSVKLGTVYESDAVMEDANQEAIDTHAAQLAEKTYKDTMKDLKRIMKKDKLIKSVYKGTKRAKQGENEEEEAAKLLEGYNG